MGIEGINNLKGLPMNDEQQSQGLPGSQQSESADQPPQPTPPTPAHEETARVTPDADESALEADTAEPDAALANDESGDTELPEELAENASDQPAQPDQVDQADSGAHGA